MIKKILLILLCSLALISCGKKDDPKYEDPEKKAKMQTIVFNIV